MSNEIESLRFVLATFKTRREQTLAMLEKQDSMISALEEELAHRGAFVAGEVRAEELPGSTPTRRRAHTPSPAGGIYSKMPLGVAAVHYLQSKGTIQATKAVLTALQEGGQAAKSKNPYRLVYNTLAARSRRKNPDVEKAGTGWKYRPPESTE